MVCNTQNYWVFSLCPSSGILETRKHITFRKLDHFPSSGEGETLSQLSPLQRDNLNQCQIQSQSYFTTGS
jgi:hypothetical protein